VNLPADQLASVTRHEQGGVIVATVRGEIDVSNATQIGRELTEVPNHLLGLVVDLGAVRYLDSTAIALLYELHIRLERRGQGLAVVAPADGAPRRVLAITAFETRAAVADHVEAAVAAVRQGVARGSPPD
jgi:anti-sigma B factor antagonist